MGGRTITRPRCISHIQLVLLRVRWEKNMMVTRTRFVTFCRYRSTTLDVYSIKLQYNIGRNNIIHTSFFPLGVGRLMPASSELNDLSTAACNEAAIHIQSIGPFASSSPRTKDNDESVLSISIPANQNI